MQSFPQEELLIISARQVALRVGRKNLCLGQKIQNWQKFSQISWNLGWMSTIKHYAGPKKLRPKFGVYHAFCDALVPSLALPSRSWFTPCKHDFAPNNGSSCAWACYFPIWPSPKSFGHLGACNSVVDSLCFLHKRYLSPCLPSLCWLRWKWGVWCLWFLFPTVW